LPVPMPGRSIKALPNMGLVSLPASRSLNQQGSTREAGHTEWGEGHTGGDTRERARGCGPGADGDDADADAEAAQVMRTAQGRGFAPPGEFDCGGDIPPPDDAGVASGRCSLFC